MEVPVHCLMTTKQDNNNSKFLTFSDHYTLLTSKPSNRLSSNYRLKERNYLYYFYSLFISFRDRNQFDGISQNYTKR